MAGVQKEQEYLLDVRNLKVQFPVNSGLFGMQKQFLKAVDDISFQIREGETRVGDGRTDALAGFGDGLVGHTDEIKAGETAMHITFNGDEAAGITVGNGGINSGDLTAHSSTIQHLA